MPKEEEDKKLIDEIMKDPDMKAAIEEEIAIRMNALLDDYKKEAAKKQASKKSSGKSKKVDEKPKCFGHYYEDNKATCRACRFAQDCKNPKKKKK